MQLLKEGDCIRETYLIEKFLGEGAFAEVYRVRHQFMGRQAMKVFKRIGMDRYDIDEMLGEAVLLSKIGHPNIIRVFDANVFETPRGICGYFTMENVPGGSLESFWQSYGTDFVPLEITIDIMCQVCRGLAVAHKENPPIVHRDIKPQNILIGYEPEGIRARVCDFGLAKKVNPLTLLATAAGTLAFKPPEIFHDLKTDSCAGDVWALGVTLYLMLTDRLPYEVDPVFGWSDNHSFDKELTLPSYCNPTVDIALEKIVLRCLDFDQKNRYLTAKELLDDLEGWKKPAHRESNPPKCMSSELSKDVLGIAHSPLNHEEAQRLARMALTKVKQEGYRGLSSAADIMEEAFNKSPSLREKYANLVRLWRDGKVM